MKQRVSLARALVHDPQVIVMDEPANGLDPRARIELRELVKALAENGKAILISSHILSELEEMCTTSVIIERGRRLSTDFEDDTAWIRLRFAQKEGEDFLARLLEMPGVKEAEAAGNGFRTRIASGDEAAAELAKSLFSRGLVPIHFASEAGRLEDVFMHVTKGALA
jgi:ABC-2 type transport system ATP-binding protein